MRMQPSIFLEKEAGIKFGLHIGVLFMNRIFFCYILHHGKDLIMDVIIFICAKECVLS
jgi:hypothetical protein